MNLEHQNVPAAADTGKRLRPRELSDCLTESSRAGPERDLETVIPTDVPGRVSVERAVLDGAAGGLAVRAARGVRRRDVRTLARELLGMTQPEFSLAFKGSPMKRAKLRGLKRNAAEVLGSVGTADDIDALARALDDEEPLVREHAARALARLEQKLAN